MREGWRRLRGCSLAAAVLAGALDAAEQPAPLRLKLQPPRAESALLPAELIARSSTGEERRWKVAGANSFPLQLALHLPAVGIWTFELASETAWSPPVTVELSGNRALPGEVDLRFYPATKVTGTLVGEIPSDARREARLHWFRPTEDPTPGVLRDSVPEGSNRCSLDDGRLSCVLPLGDWHLRLDVAGLASRWFWNHPIAPPASPLGRIELAPEARVRGQVVTEHSHPVEGAEVRLRLLRPGGTAPLSPAAVRASTWVARTDSSGQFLFSGLPSGLASLAARAEGWAPGVPLGLSLKDGATLEISPPLLLRRFVQFDLLLEPAQAPGGGLLQSTLAPLGRSGSSSRLRLQRVGPGLHRSGELPPGHYLLEVVTPAGQRVLSEVVDLSVSRRLERSIPWIEVEGEVLSSGEPVSADLLFGGVGGASRFRTTAREGFFSLPLPRPGRWRVDVLRDAEPALRGLEVEVRAPERGNRARLTIELPRTRLSGWVVWPTGEAAGGVEVVLAAGDERSFAKTRTDVHGQFVFDGMVPGRRALQAEASRSDGAWYSQLEFVNLRDNEPAAAAQLLLAPSRRFRGRITIPTGPLSGARLAALPRTRMGRSSAALFLEATSDADGNFELELPHESSSVALIAWAPGFGLVAREIDCCGTPGELRLDRGESGTVLLSVEPASEESIEVLEIDGIAVPAAFLRSVGADPSPQPAFGSAAVLSGMPPGRYRWCALAREALDEHVLEGDPLPDGSCTAAGHLHPGELLDLRPVPEAAEPQAEPPELR